jgi:prepilin signal peptidase PulO-like enzyme (type II secretory pathway)
VAGLQGYKDQGLFSDGVWVTPGLPHLVFMTASLVITVVIGDLLMWLFFRAVGVS